MSNHGIAQDLAFSVRTLRRRPLFAATAVVTLALGIGATTAMFTVIDGVLLRPLPYHDPSRLVTIYTTFPYWKGRPVVGPQWNTLRTPYPDYQNLIKSQRSFEGVGGFQISNASLALGRETVVVTEGLATANLLPLLGVSTAVGRWFLPGEDGASAPRLVVLSDALWRNRLGGDRAILGRIVRIDEEPFTVVGILPPGFGLTAKQVETNGTSAADLWIPFGVYRGMLTPNNHTLELIGRLLPGKTIAAALADAEPLLRGGRSATRRGADIVPRDEVETNAVRRPLWLLFASVALLLLIACGNIAMLFLSECIVRLPELGTRSMLGAGRARLARMLLAESATIAAAGATAGVVVAWWGTRALLALAPSEIPHARSIALDWRVCLFVIGLAGFVALAAGFVPAWTLTRADRDRGTGSRVTPHHARLQTFVIGLQACMSVMLMTGAGLLARSVVNEQRVDAGFRSANMLAVRVDLPTSLDRTNADHARLSDDVEQSLRGLPGVANVTYAMTLPLGGRVNGQAVSLALDEKLGGPSTAEAERAVVAPNYFSVLHIPVLAGRVFTAADRDSAPLVSVVSQGFARRFWPNETAIGKQFRSPGGVATVVGIVGDVKNKALTREPEALFYRPQSQSSARLSYILETRGDPLAVARSAQRAVWTAVSGATVSEVTSLDALVQHALAPARYRALLAGIFAALALLLTAVGLAGLTARGVANRLRELCIRMALGATPTRALALALSRGIGAVVVGLCAGIVLAPLATSAVTEYLFGVSGTDTPTYGSVALIALAVCTVATVAATKRLRSANLAAVLRSD